MLVSQAQASNPVGFLRLFRAKRGTDIVRLASISARDLRVASRTENVVDLLELAKQENRIDDLRALQLVRIYRTQQSGDELLLRCLQVPACEPASFLKIVQTSSLHAEVALRAPAMNATQVNHAVGQISENMMTRYFRAGRWEQLEGQVGRTGIDGLFVTRRDGVIRDVLIAESKYNGAMLGETQHGTQMSKDWILRKLHELQMQFPGRRDYIDIERMVQGDAYRGVLWQFNADERELQVNLNRLHSKGGEVAPTSLPEVDATEFGAADIQRIPLVGAQTLFQRQIVSWYREEIGRIPRQ